MDADLAVPLDANIENADDVDDDAAIQALMAGTVQGAAPSAPSGRPKSASPKSKGRKISANSTKRAPHLGRRRQRYCFT